MGWWVDRLGDILVSRVLSAEFATLFLEMDMPVTEEDMKKALKAFRKRMKATQLDEDSRLGRSPLTGAKSKIVSMQPPSGFGREVWEELAQRGFLKQDGGGFYQIVEGKSFT